MRQSAYKPGSGRHADSLSAGATAIPLGRRLPGASSNLPGRQGLDIDPEAFCACAQIEPLAVPIRSCSRWGLPCRRRCRRRGALLPHRFTLAAVNATPAAVCSLWHCPWAHARRMLSGTACPWSPDFPPRHSRLTSCESLKGAPERPSSQLTKLRMGMLAGAVKRPAAPSRAPAPKWSSPDRAWQANPARWRASMHRRRHRPVPGGNGAGRLPPRRA